MVVKYGLNKSRKAAIVSSFLPAIVFTFVYCNDFIEARINGIFMLLAVLTLFLQIQAGWLYFKNPTGKMTYYSLATNFRACACGQATFVALFNTQLAVVLFLISYVFVGVLFDLHSNRMA